MTDEEIAKLARKAGISFDHKYHWYVSNETLRRFAAMLLEKPLQENKVLRDEVAFFKERWRQM
jgi:hypothetical protein